jgi:hypothetical protein
VLVIDARQLRRPWYIRQLLRRQSGLLRDASSEANAYIAACGGDPRPDAAQLAVLQHRLLAALASAVALQRPLYATIGMSERLFPGMEASAAGMALRLTALGEQAASGELAASGAKAASGEQAHFRFRPAPRSDDAIRAVLDRYFRAYARGGTQLWKEGRREEADRLFEKASTFPQFTPSERWKAWQALAPQLSSLY